MSAFVIIRFHEFMEKERERWARRIRRVFNKVEKLSKTLVFKSEMSEEELAEYLAELEAEFAVLRRRMKIFDEDD